MPKVGLEPTPTCVDRILSPARLPFRHFGAVEFMPVYPARERRQPSIEALYRAGGVVLSTELGLADSLSAAELMQ